MSRHPVDYRLPQGWRQTISPGDMGWIGRSLFVAKGKMTDKCHVCPGLSSATHATSKPSRHTYGLSIVLAPESIWRFSCNGLVSKIAIALPYLRAHGSRPFLYAKRAHFLHSFRILRS